MLVSMIVAAATVAQAGQSAPVAGRYELAERLKRVESVWLATPDKTKRAGAVAKLTRAAGAIEAQSLGDACRALDDAAALLEGRELRIEDAVTLRFDPPYAEPKTPARLRIGWAYMPQTPGTTRVSIGRQSIVATPGRNLTIEIRPETINTELLMNPEIGYLMPIQVGAFERSAYLSIVKKPKERVASLIASSNPEARTLATYLEDILEDPMGCDSDVSIIQRLFQAELLDEGRLRLERADQIPLVLHKGTYFRVAFPNEHIGQVNANRPATVVVALPGSTGTENSFFEGYGRGAAVDEALRRGWVFVSPRPHATGVANALDWIRTRRNLRIERLFVLAHGEGLNLALQAVTQRPRAMALLGPAQSLPDAFPSLPVYFSVGKQDPLAQTARQLGQTLQGRRDGSAFQEFDPCEHLMIVPESLQAAFRFFDKQ